MIAITIVVAGVNNQDMYIAVKAIEKMQGGFVLVENEMVKAGLALTHCWT
ncbi:hypothetical protein DMNBHIDG_02198 [Candidatus Methanoperedenaceae archaeon GB37]|nr:hypothetical protein DMNBHIDG_02198 [Candidatus Methanoperedenaceae archaeon GB37]